MIDIKRRDSLAELVNAGDLKSLGLVPCGFESHGCRFFDFIIFLLSPLYSLCCKKEK